MFRKTNSRKTQILIMRPSCIPQQRQQILSTKLAITQLPEYIYRRLLHFQERESLNMKRNGGYVRNFKSNSLSKKIEPSKYKN